jgi:hypothetical protein
MHVKIQQAILMAFLCVVTLGPDRTWPSRHLFPTKIHKNLMNS